MSGGQKAAPDGPEHAAGDHSAIDDAIRHWMTEVGAMPPLLVDLLLVHLARTCAGCASTVVELAAEEAAKLGPVATPAPAGTTGAAPESGGEEEGMPPPCSLSRVLFSEELSPETEAELEAVLALPRSDRPAALADRPGLHRIAVWCRLMDRAVDTPAALHARGDEPGGEKAAAAADAAAAAAADAADLAELALELASHLPRQEIGTELINDARALAASALGAARQLEGRLGEALRVLHRAEEIAITGSGDPHVYAEILMQRALLARKQGDLPASISLLGTVVEIFERSGDPRMQGIVLTQLAAVLQQAGNLNEGRRALSRGRGLLAEARRLRRRRILCLQLAGLIEAEVVVESDLSLMN